jgi:hypothetical protein
VRSSGLYVRSGGPGDIARMQGSTPVCGRPGEWRIMGARGARTDE